MKQKLVKLSIALLLLCSCCTAEAQQRPMSRAEKRENLRNRIVVVMPDGKDSVMTRVGFIWPKGKYEKQTRIGVVDSLGNETWFTADQVIQLRDKKKAYRTVKMQDENGTVKRIFPQNTYYGMDGNP